MIIKSLKITEIALIKVDSRNSDVEMQISFSNDTPITLRAHVDDNYDLFINKLIKTIKTVKQVNTEYDDDNTVLKGISVLAIINEEEIKEITPKRLNLLNNRLDLLKKTKTASDYIRMYQQLSTLKEVIYHSGSY